MSLLVHDPGLASRIVDYGRPRTRSLGVAIGGAADRRSWTLGNALLGNSLEAAALEVTLKGPRLRAETDVACVLFGAPFTLLRDGMPLPVGHTFTLHEGQELQIGGAREGMRAYLCVRGGFQNEMILASRSGLANVNAGDLLPCAASHIHGRYCPDLQPVFPKIWTVRVLPGLQASWFDATQFHRQTFTVTPSSNRMGLRLQSEALKLPERELVSEAVCPGAIQVTRDGQCIILAADGQTIGGYPKIAQVIQADFDALGQMRPGAGVRFVPISMEEAIQATRQTRAELQLWALHLGLSLDAFPAERNYGNTNALTS